MRSPRVTASIRPRTTCSATTPHSSPASCRNEVNNCPEMPGTVTVRAEAHCNALFCILNAHKGDQHVDATGYPWIQATPPASAVAHVLTVAQDEPDCRGLLAPWG